MSTCNVTKVRATSVRTVQSIFLCAIALTSTCKPTRVQATFASCASGRQTLRKMLGSGLTSNGKVACKNISKKNIQICLRHRNKLFASHRAARFSVSCLFLLYSNFLILPIYSSAFGESISLSSSLQFNLLQRSIIALLYFLQNIFLSFFPLMMRFVFNV